MIMCLRPVATFRQRWTSAGRSQRLKEDPNLALDLSDLLEEAELPEWKLKPQLVIAHQSNALPSTENAHVHPELADPALGKQTKKQTESIIGTCSHACCFGKADSGARE